MKVYMEEANLNYFEALASPTRLQIIRLLSQREYNIKELADILDISSSIVTKHVRKLESAQLITTSNISRNGSRYKQCSLVNMVVEVHPPAASSQIEARPHFVEAPLAVGLFTALETAPPCGMASENKVIGRADSPAHLFLAERADAQLLWLTGGYVEYTIPNFFAGSRLLEAVEIIGEFGPQLDERAAPSPIALYLNEVPICTFYAMGEPAPGPWPYHRFGSRVVIRVDHSGMFIGGERKSGLQLSELDIDTAQWVLRLEVSGPPSSGSGLTIYGDKASRGGQGPLLKAYYKSNFSS